MRDGRIIQGPDGGEMKPGRAGWPTIRYFNAKTGCAPPSTPAPPTLAPPCAGSRRPDATRVRALTVVSTGCADDGAAYDKKTSKAMCDELGDLEYMRAYVEEQGEGKAPAGGGKDDL